MNRSRLLLALLLAAVPLARAGEGPAPAPIRVANGLLQGRTGADAVQVYLGIPYARPPVGELRWREPQPLADWAGVRPATAFGARPVQPFLWRDMIFRSPPASEDCLYLNVWCPPGGPAPPRPVLVYFHGGGFVGGDGSETRYDGLAMARQGIVTVTVNYRLGVLGFLSLPELTAESPFHASGNYGLLDQAAALEWVRRNIAAFGGDPQHITIAGQSAGAGSVCALMASPLTRDLLAGAIGESGSLFNFTPALSLAAAEREGTAFAARAGTRSLAELRALPADRILALQQGLSWARRVVVDGHFFREPPAETYFTGQQADIPLLGGYNLADISGPRVVEDAHPSPAAFAAEVTRLYGAKAPRILEMYPARTPAEAARANLDLSRDRTVAFRVWKWLDAVAKSGGHPVYRYLFAQPQPPAVDEPADQPPNPLPPHSAEIPYCLGNLPVYTFYRWTPDDYQASRVMQSYFAHFIRTGDPNGEGLPRWTAMQASIPHVMVISAQPRLEPEPDLPRFTLLDSP